MLAFKRALLADKVVMLQKRNQELEVERVLCAELHGRTLLPPPPRAARVQACLWKVLLPRDAACTRRAALTSARGDRAPHGSAFGKLRRRPTAPHRGPAGLGNAGQAASSASARSRGPRTVKSLCGASPLYRCFAVGGAVRGLWCDVQNKTIFYVRLCVYTPDHFSMSSTEFRAQGHRFSWARRALG